MKRYNSAWSVYLPVVVGSALAWWYTAIALFIEAGGFDAAPTFIDVMIVITTGAIVYSWGAMWPGPLMIRQPEPTTESTEVSRG